MQTSIKKIILKYRSWFLIGLFIMAIFLFYFSETYLYFDYTLALSRYEDLKIRIAQEPVQSQILFFFAYLFITAFSLPLASLFTIFGSALFGWNALIIILLAASIGASLLFLAARTILSDWLYKRTYSHRFLTPPDFKENAFFLLLGLRLFPIAPFWIVNIVPAFTTISLRSYFLATLIGIMPGTIIYVWLGQTIDELLLNGEWPNLMTLVDSRIWLPLLGLGLLMTVSALYRTFTRQTNSDKAVTKEKNG
jgi:uncharacterized membrane protein YdjX (TVP38/TMEM64 family)